MFESRIYVGLSDRDSHEQLYDTEMYKEVCKAFHQESVLITSNTVLRFNVRDDPEQLRIKFGDVGI